MLDNTTVLLGIGVQVRIDFKVNGKSENYSTVDFADANHVTLASLSSTEITLMKDGEPLSQNIIPIGDSR